jgi:thiol-disulfide isomerase/thioredoxin
MLTVLVVVTVSACRSDPGRPPAVDRLPERGLFATSSAHFDKVIRSGALPTVVNVWASWCIPCRREAPLLRRAAARYKSQIRFLGVDTQDTRAEGLKFIDKFRIPYPNGFDTKGEVAHHLKTLGVPATFFYRSGGNLALAHNGEIHADDLQTKIESLLQSSGTSGRKGD